MKVIEVATAVIVNSENKVLLTQRYDPENPDIHLKWQVPGGGIEKGEKPETACLREILEETGLHIKLLSKEPLKILQKYPAATFNLNTFLATPISGTINTKLDVETHDAKWFDFDEISKLPILDNTLEMVENCLQLWKKL